MEKDIYIYAHWNIYSKETEYQISTYQHGESSGDVLIEKRSVSFDTPNDKGLRVNLAAAHRVRLNYMRGEHTKEEMEVQETINELTSIEFKPDTATADQDNVPLS